MFLKLALLSLICWAQVATAATHPLCPSSPVRDTYNYTSKDYTLAYREYDNIQWIDFHGQLMPVSSNEGLDELAQHLQRNKDIFLEIENSAGGYLASFRKFATTLRDFCPAASCHIYTYLARGCASACVELFMRGDQKIASSVAHFGFHQEWAGIPPFTFKVQSKSEFAATYLALGADPTWMQNNLDRLTSTNQDVLWIDVHEALTGKIAQRMDDEPFYAWSTPSSLKCSK